MKQFILVYTLVVCTRLFVNAQAIINGDTSVCAGQTITYTASGGGTYNWSVTGPGGIVGVANSNTVAIVWDSAGSSVIHVTATNNNGSSTASLHVTIHPNPNPQITWPAYPTCPSSTNTNGAVGGTGSSGQGKSSSCINVCKNSTIVYSTSYYAGSTYVWTVNGTNSFTGQGTNSITVNWDSSALGGVTVVETNQWGCTDSNSICIIKVDVPSAYFTAASNVCLNTANAFNNLSIGATSYQWYFGDGGSSTAFDPTHAYASGGTYTITLIASNACHCTDTFRRTITVNSEPGPDIECPSTVCAGDTETYYTIAAGCNYNWIVSGGTIISGLTTSSIRVAWGPGMIGLVSLYVTGCGSYCSDTTTVTIPIIPSVATISGPKLVCPGDCETYSLPPFSGGVFSWSISGSGMGAITSLGCNCCNAVEICWTAGNLSGNDTLNVSYYDSFLNCGGTGQLVIHLRPQLSLNSNSPACVNSLSYISAGPGINCNWNISPTGPTFTGNGTSFIAINWLGNTGTYTITAVALIPTQTCNDSAVTQVQVVAAPPNPTITGDTVICPNNTYSYCSGSTNITWIITGGTPAIGNGNCITVQWGNAGPYEVQAYQQLSTAPYCASDTTTQLVYTVPLATPPVITGPGTVCANGTDTFVNTNIYPANATLTWSISPPNAGSILGGQGTNSINIQWGDSAPSSLVITLTVVLCSQTLSSSKTVNLLPAPTPSIVVNGTFCPGDSVTLSATGGAYTAYQWSGPGAFSSNSNPSAYITATGFYQITVTDANGCTGNMTKQINQLPGPVASISTSDQTSYCIPAVFIVQLNALANPNYTYSWTGGSTTNPITVTGAGTYAVTITDQNHCTAVSNAIIITVDSCNGNGGGNGSPCTPNGSISFTHSGCNPVSFTNTSVNGSDFSWTFGNGGTSALTNPTYLYPLAGFYLVTLSGYVPNTSGTDSCLLTDTAQLKIPLAPRFDFIAGCAGDSFCFTDLSTYTPGNNITSWSWNFGNGNTSTQQNPCNIYATGGTYIVTLTIGDGSCFATISDTVVVLSPPVAAFTFTSPSCVNSNTPFTDASIPPASINSWSWTFGDGGTSLNQNPDHSYSSPGHYTVQLIVSNNSGCRDTVSHPINILAPNVPGNITAFPDTIVCAGSSILLVAPACIGCSYAWSNAGTHDSTTVNATGIYSVTVTDANGCTAVLSIHIVIQPAPPVTITNYGASKFCLGGNTTISGIYSANYLYSWSSNYAPDNGSTNFAVTVAPATAGIYYFILIVTDTATGCTDTSLPYVITVTALPAPPLISAIGSTNICQGSTVALVAIPPPVDALQWSTGDITDTIYAGATGCYTATVMDSNGCDNSATICVTVYAQPETCSFWTGCVDTCNPYTIHGPSGQASYQWLLNGVPINGATSQNYVATGGGVYSLVLTNSYGCTDTTGDLNLTLHNCPNSICVEVVSDTVYCNAEGSYTLKYYIVNHSGRTLDESSLLILPPNLGALYGPISSIDTILNGDTSAIQTATIYNMPAGSTLCFIVFVQQLDSVGNQMFCCNSDTLCIKLPPCNNNCCYLNILSDSVWCTGVNAVGLQTYGFKVVVDGCGTLVLQSSEGATTDSSVFTLIAGNPEVITGIFTEPQNSDEGLCITFVMEGGGVVCADTTICLKLPPCNTNCCYLNILSDSIWCTGLNEVGLQTYGFKIVVEGCGNLVLQTTQGTTTDSSSYTLVAGNPVVIYGAFTQIPTVKNNLPCITLVVSGGGVVCADTTICLTLPNCITNCCYLNILLDSVWCTGVNPVGLQTYGFEIVVNGCGNLVLQNSEGTTTDSSSYTLVAGNNTIIYGTYTQPQGSDQGNLCVTLIMQGAGGVACADTTICLKLPPCNINCCYLNILSDSVWCTTLDINNGQNTYGFQVVVEGCGTLTLETTAGTNINNTTYTLVAGVLTIISGIYTEPQNTEGLLCLTFQMGGGGVICADTTVCIPIRPCNNCCPFIILSDSVWCAESDIDGGTTYGFDVKVEGCGNLILTAPGTNINNTSYTLVSGVPLVIDGSFTVSPLVESNLCLSFQVSNAVAICADTTICLPLPNCNVPPPCALKFPATICVGLAAVFSYTGDTTGYTFNWTFSHGSPPNATGPGPHNVVYSTTGCFPVTLTITKGLQTYTCYDTICVVAYPVALITPSGSTTFCQGGSVVLTASGGTEYDWSNNEYTPGIIAETSGNYEVTVTNLYGCIATATITVTVNTNPTPTITTKGDTAVCSGASATLSVGSYKDYAWSTGATTATIKVTTSGLYTVTVTNANGCTGTASQNITVYPLPVAAITGATTGCGEVTLTAIGGGTYKWSGGSSPYTATNSFTASGTYTVTATSGNGCTASASAKVTADAVPTAVITGVTSACGSVTLKATGGGTYDWSGGSSPTTATNTLTTSGKYTVTVTGTDKCTAMASDSVTIYASPLIIMTGASTACGEVSLTAAGGISYKWSGGESPNSATDIFTSGGTYSLTVTNANGCSATASEKVTVEAIPVVAITGTISGCTSVTLKASGGGTYKWSGGSSPTAATNTFTTSGSYTVTVTGTDKCTVTASDSVTIYGNPVIIMSGLTTACGEVSLTAAGGNTYKWSGGSSPNTAPNTFTASGTYTLTVTNANGCSATTSEKVAVDALPTAVITVTKNTLCSGGSAVLTATSGAGYTYAWSTGATTRAITITSTGTHDVTVTGSDKCTASASVTPSCIDDAADKSGDNGNNNSLSDSSAFNSGNFNVTVYPNPYSGEFHLKVISSSNENINVKIFDVAGKLLEERREVSYGTDIVLGNGYADGVYLIQVSQGDVTKAVRVVKSE